MAVIEITETQILADGSPLADIDWRATASYSERDLVQAIHDPDGEAYDARREGIELGYEQGLEDANRETGRLWDKLEALTVEDFDMQDSEGNPLDDIQAQIAAEIVLRRVLTLLEITREAIPQLDGADLDA